jgi:hypothetical protein
MRSSNAKTHKHKNHGSRSVLHRGCEESIVRDMRLSASFPRTLHLNLFTTASHLLFGNEACAVVYCRTECPGHIYTEAVFMSVFSPILCSRSPCVLSFKFFPDLLPQLCCASHHLVLQEQRQDVEKETGGCSAGNDADDGPVTNPFPSCSNSRRKSLMGCGITRRKRSIVSGGGHFVQCPERSEGLPKELGVQQAYRK